MKVSAIIERMRDTLPFLHRRVDGILSFSRIDLSRHFAMPCAFVILESEAVTNEDFTNIWQAIIEQEFTIVVYANAETLKDLEIMDFVEDLRADLVKSLCGFDVNGEVLRYRGLDTDPLGGGRVCVKFSFFVESTITNKETAFYKTGKPIGSMSITTYTPGFEEPNHQIITEVHFKE